VAGRVGQTAQGPARGKDGDQGDEERSRRLTSSYVLAGGRCSATVGAYAYPVPGWRNGFTSAARATAWLLDLSAVPKDKPAVQAFGWFQQEIPRGISGKRSDHMFKVLLDLSLGKSQPLRKLA
jgi:hypothetical protein